MVKNPRSGWEGGLGSMHVAVYGANFGVLISLLKQNCLDGKRAATVCLPEAISAGVI